MDVLAERVLGPLLQLAGAVAIVIGFGLWLGDEAAWLSAGVLLVIVGTLLEIPGARRTNFVVISEGEEVSISDEGAGTID